MEQETFKASVTYDDYLGSAAADRADREPIEHWLKDRGLKTSKEQVCGITLSIGENDGKELVNPVQINVLLVEGDTIESVRETIAAGNSSLNVKRVSTVMTLSEFFSLFKRFELTLSPSLGYWESHGLLEGVRLTVTHGQC